MPFTSFLAAYFMEEVSGHDSWPGSLQHEALGWSFSYRKFFVAAFVSSLGCLVLDSWPFVLILFSVREYCLENGDNGGEGRPRECLEFDS